MVALCVLLCRVPSRAVCTSAGGQFGETNMPWVNDLTGLAGAAGNAFSPSLVTAEDGTVFLWHNDESAHSGLHRWRFRGLDTVEWVAAEPMGACD